MTTTLTAIAPTLYSAAREVAREPFAAVQAVNTSFDNKGVAFGDKVTVPVMPSGAAKDFTPGIINTAAQSITASKVDVEILKRRKYDMVLTGEQIRSLENGGNYQDWVTQFIKQGARTLRNEMEIDCVNAIRDGASRSVGTSETNPFASNLDVLADARKVLVDNGAPMADAHFIMGTAASNALQKLGIYQQAYAAGDDGERRTGGFRPQFGFNMAESAGVSIHTKGTGASYLVNGALTIGQTVITADTGTGTIVVGDVVTFAGDTVNQYVVTGALAGGSFTIGDNGIRAEIADNAAITVTNDYTGNLAFERNAVVGVVRPPLIPVKPGDAQLSVSDETGMSYLLLDSVQYGQRVWELHTCWGFKSVNGAFSAVVKG